MRACVLRIVCLLGILCAGAAQARADVGDFIGRRVGSVRLAIEGRETTEPFPAMETT